MDRSKALSSRLVIKVNNLSLNFKLALYCMQFLDMLEATGD